ncbi:helveticin J family class III bacteriocin [Lactobacillus helveticus]|uniref:helveticin J family class III bacteriocin n=1 Tax=Lactobacillus helveticus TaxID=1587 RepID=UPI00339031E2
MLRRKLNLNGNISYYYKITMDYAGNGYFTIFDNDLINNELDNVEYSDGYVNLGELSYLESFVIPGFYENLKSSVQGYDIDNLGNIYVSSQKSPDTLNHKYYSKNIFKIPTYDRFNTSNWLQVDLDKYAGPINIYGQGMHTELEGIQILDENHCYLTVAYHKTVRKKNKTVSNKIYEVSWNE